MLVLDLLTPVVAGPAAVRPRIFARELAVGANSLDVVLLGLKMEALLLPLPAPSAAVVPVLSSKGASTAGFVVELARTLLRELVDPMPGGFNNFAPVLLDRLGARELGAPPFVATSPDDFNALLDADPMRAGAMLFLLARASDGRDAARDGFLEGTGFISFDSVASVVAALGLVVVAFVRDAFAGEPMPKFHTLRTIDLAEERIPKRGVALPLSAGDSVNGSFTIGREKETYCSQPAVQQGSSHAYCSFSSPFLLRASFA